MQPNKRPNDQFHQHYLQDLLVWQCPYQFDTIHLETLHSIVHLVKGGRGHLLHEIELLQNEVCTGRVHPRVKYEILQKHSR